MKRRLKSAAFSAAILAAVLAAVVLGGTPNGGSLPVSSLPADVGFYAISYMNIENSADAELLERDIEYMKARGLEGILPAGIGAKPEPFSTGRVMLFFENCGAFELITDILRQNGMCGVFTADETLCESMSASQKFRVALESGIAETAGRVSGCENEIELYAALNAERMRMFQAFALPCKTFVHVCKGLVCRSCFALTEKERESAADGILIVTYGSGVNELLSVSGGVTLLNRIVRLPDWTIEEYFSSVAGRYSE